MMLTKMTKCPNSRSWIFKILFSKECALIENSFLHFFDLDTVTENEEAMVISSSSNNDFSSSLRYRNEFQKDNIGVTNSKSKLFYHFNFMVLIKHVFFN